MSAFEAGDSGLGGSDEFGELTLAQPTFREGLRAVGRAEWHASRVTGGAPATL